MWVLVLSSMHDQSTSALAMYDCASLRQAKATVLEAFAIAEELVKDRTFQTIVASAAGGAVAMGGGGAAVGLATGTAVGAAVGVVPAIFSFGLSIPFCAAVGGGAGLVTCAVGGATAGAMAGGTMGYGLYVNWDQVAMLARRVVLPGPGTCLRWPTVDAAECGKVQREDSVGSTCLVEEDDSLSIAASRGESDTAPGMCSADTAGKVRVRPPEPSGAGGERGIQRDARARRFELHPRIPQAAADSGDRELAEVITFPRGTSVQVVAASSRTHGKDDKLEPWVAETAEAAACKAEEAPAIGMRGVASDMSLLPASAISAAGGAILLGASGGPAGLAAGMVVGATAGLLPALFTFGLSIPIGAAIGGGAGLISGVATGTIIGAAGGGVVGYRMHSSRERVVNLVNDSLAKV